MLIQFEVYGKPATQGSKRVLPIGKGDHRRHVLVDSCKDLKPWRHTVASIAAGLYSGPLLDEPIAMACIFDRVRPSGHLGTGCNAGVVKAWAPEAPVTTPDSLKQARAIEDALSKVIYKDDSRISCHVIVKQWGPVQKTTIIVATYDAMDRWLAAVKQCISEISHD